jgi:hypothetical protein
MQSSLRFESAISVVEAERRVCDRRNWIASAVASGLTALALLLIWRRATGAIHDPLPAAGLLLFALLLAAIAALAHGTRTRSADRDTANIIANIALSIALLAVATAISLPGTSVVGLIFLWSILFVEEVWAWRTHMIRRVRRLNQPAVVREGAAPAQPNIAASKGATANVQHPAARQEPRPPVAEKNALETDEPALPEGVTQQLTRSTAADGTEELAGCLRVPFAVGQRTLNVHLAFCPPFARTPQLSVEQADGPTARIKTAQVLPYGARLELKLHAAEETPSAVVLQFSAMLEGRDEAAIDQRRTTNDQRTLP